MRNIILVQKDTKNLIELFNSISSSLNEEFRIFKIFTNGKDALEYVKKEKADVLIIDLDLPDFNAIDIISEVQASNSQVIAISEESDKVLELLKKNLHIHSLLIKPYKFDDLVNSLNNMCTADKSLSKLIDILNNFNFNKSSIGYRYIIDCINYCIKNNLRFIKQVKSLYKNVESLYDGQVYADTIEWNIYKSIRYMNTSTDNLIMKKYFIYDTFPSPKTFLNGILDIYYSSI